MLNLRIFWEALCISCEFPKIWSSSGCQMTTKSAEKIFQHEEKNADENLKEKGTVSPRFSPPGSYSQSSNLTWGLIRGEGAYCKKWNFHWGLFATKTFYALYVRCNCDPKVSPILEKYWRIYCGFNLPPGGRLFNQVLCYFRPLRRYRLTAMGA